MRDLARRTPAWAITALLGVLYLILAPYSPDLAAASYRSNLFASVGFSIWDNSWYGGHHLPAYSLLAPGLGALIGPRLLTAISMTVAAALFAALIDGAFPSRATRIAAVWCAIGLGIQMLSSRVAFDLGLAIGLGALLAARRGHMWPALGLTVLCSLASPVAGAFVALAFLAWGLGGRSRVWAGALTAAALLPIGLLVIMFPEGGTQPFVPSAFWPALLGVVVVGFLVPPERRVLRIGVALYAGALIASYVIPTAVGANSDRLGAIFAGPLAACVLVTATPSGRRWIALLVLAPFLFYWQANEPVADYAAAASDPGVKAAYYAPLLGELSRLGIGYGATPARIEVVPLATHWESRWVAPHVMLARGWERQLDRYRNPLFYEEPAALTPQRYREWLTANSVSYVALPDAKVDYSSEREAALLRGAAPPYLRPLWSSDHWRLFAVAGAAPLVSPPAVMSAVSTDSVTLRVPAAGSYLVRVHFTPYWKVTPQGCVSEAPGGWTSVLARRAGTVRLVISFSLERVLDHSARCS